MCECNGQGADHDTGKVDLQQIILDELHAIRGDLDSIKGRIERLEEKVESMDGRVEQVVTDLNTIHTFQQTYTTRLSAIEKVCASVPLHSTPVPRPAGDGKGEDGKLKP